MPDESYEELLHYPTHNDINITGQEINLDNSPKRPNMGEFKPIQIQKHQMHQEEQSHHHHQQFKTPSPYRNNDPNLQYGQHP